MFDLAYPCPHELEFLCRYKIFLGRSAWVRGVVCGPGHQWEGGSGKNSISEERYILNSEMLSVYGLWTDKASY